MKDGAVIANSGHFNVEIDIPALDASRSGRNACATTSIRFTLRDDGESTCSARAGSSTWRRGSHPAAVMTCPSPIRLSPASTFRPAGEGAFRARSIRCRRRSIARSRA